MCVYVALLSLSLSLSRLPLFSGQDSSLTTPLHLAALVGGVECVEELIARGHTVDCRDAKGWPPLLYAHFEGHQDSVLALMKARPQQVLREHLITLTYLLSKVKFV